MKNLRALLSAITLSLTAATAISAVPVINSSAAQAANNEPKVYLDFVVESDGDIRADVVMENMPEISSGSFYVALDEGLRFTKDTEGYDNEILNSLRGASTAYNIISDNLAVFSFSNQSDRNLNGHIVGFYVERTQFNNPYNSTGKIDFKSSRNTFGFLLGIDSGFMYYPEDGLGSVNTPDMLESNEYLVGDVDGDGRINASDTSHVLRQVQVYSEIKISDFNGNYNDAIADLRGAYAADVNKDGYITQADADLILRYYTLMMSGKPYDGEIGKIDIYEIYND